MGEGVRALCAVSLAAMRSTLRHLLSLTGSAWRLWLLGVLIGIVVVAANVVAASLLDRLLDSLFDPVAALPEGLRQRLLSTFVANMTLLGGVVALIVAGLTPPVSSIALAARLAGAARGVIAAGELLPGFAAMVIIVTGMQAGPVLVVSLRSPQPIVTFSAILATTIATGVAALLLRQLGAALGRALRLGDVLSRSIGMLFAMAGVTALLADLLLASVQQRESLTGFALSRLWSGKGVPETPLELLTSLLAVMALLPIACVSAAWLVARAPLQPGHRLFPLRPAGRPTHFTRFFSREVMLCLRHPVTTMNLITTAVIMGFGVLAGRAGALPAGALAMLYTVLCAAGAETAHGRTRRWSWVARTTGHPLSVRVCARVLGVFAVHGTLLLLGLAATVPVSEFPPLLGAALPSFTVLLLLSFCAGTYLPYSEDAPLGGAATTALVLAVEIVWLLAEAWIVRTLGASLLLPVQLAAGCAAFLLAFVLARRDEAVLMRGAPTG